MGFLKTSKNDNRTVGFECIYGGLESPFGGIDASKNARYIDPKCFVDASNFVLVEGELCTSGYVSVGMPSNGVTYPMASTATDPGVLLGVGKLPCENVVKNWALFCSPTVDASNFWHYRILLWTQNTLGTNDTTPPEMYDFAVYETNIPTPAVNATASITINYTNPLSAIQSETEHNLNLTGGGTRNPPYAYGTKLYEDSAFNLLVNGAPAGYATTDNDTLAIKYFTLHTTPASGPPPLPTPNDVATILGSTINASLFPFQATVSGNVVNLRAFTQSGKPSVDGAAGNALSITGNMVLHDMIYYPLTAGLSPVPVLPPTFIAGQNDFTFPSFVLSASAFQGGVDAKSIPNLPIQILSYDTIGSSIYFAGFPADYMLQYRDVDKFFGYLTTYQGERVIKKFGGHLIGLGLINSSFQTEDYNWLWFNWSSASDLSQWQAIDPVTSLATGAGGEQIEDISDLPTGLVVSNSVAFILRAEGLSYVTELQSSDIPFEISHVDLAKDGQGCPSVSLWTQFDQLGFYVGQSNVFMLSQSPQAIGDKIWKTLFPALQAVSNRLSDPPVPLTIVGNPPPFLDKYYEKVNVETLTFPNNQSENIQFAINISGLLFLFNPIDSTWMKVGMSPFFGPETQTPDFKWGTLKCISLPQNSTMGFDGSYQNKESYVYGQSITGGTSYSAPLMVQIIPFLNSTQSAYIWFPQEEISLGRDITIDALYMLVAGVPGLHINFTIDGMQKDPITGNFDPVTAAFSGSLVLDNDASPGVLQEYQVFDATGKAITLKAPQLKLTIPAQSIGFSPAVPYPINSQPQFKASKIAMYGSFDPNQRPV